MKENLNGLPVTDMFHILCKIWADYRCACTVMGK